MYESVSIVAFFRMRGENCGHFVRGGGPNFGHFFSRLFWRFFFGFPPQQLFHQLLILLDLLEWELDFLKSFFYTKSQQIDNLQFHNDLVSFFLFYEWVDLFLLFWVKIVMIYATLTAVAAKLLMAKRLAPDVCWHLLLW